MASDKQKRFRVHVVKEIYETEKEYTKSLEFTVTYMLEKAKQKAQNPHENSFTNEDIVTLFCNTEQILELHRQLMSDLESCMDPKGPSYEMPVSQCYLKHREAFNQYKQYGENNEAAQKLLYELVERPSLKAFFVGCMLLGSKGDDELSSYFFKPIQRVCKYPLLFRELMKYTPREHPDFSATQEALSVMRELCSVINEAKRRVEKLEAIADWQATVEGWEGSNVVDTCNELVKEGTLVKISAGNTQERQFYLFDHLFVYCKKAAILPRSRKNLLFRGRVPVENLTIENIEDGTADFYTNGIAVNNSWKVNNIAKNKWFVLIAKTPEEKQAWMDAIRRVKEKRKRVADGIALDTRNLILDKAEKIYHLLKKDQIPKDHKFRLRTYPHSFTGQDLVKWLVERKVEVTNADEAVILCQAMLENGVIHHVNDRHQFKNCAETLYRFRYDDGTFRSKIEGTELAARGIRIYCRLHGLFDRLIKEHSIGLRKMRCVVNSSKLLDWLISERDILNRGEGIVFGQDLFATGVLRHATDEQNFKDGAVLYRFTADDGHEGPREKERRLTQVASKTEFCSTQIHTCKTLTLPYSELDHSYGVELKDQHPVTIKFASPDAQLCGAVAGQTVVSINGTPIDPRNPSEFLDVLKPKSRSPLPLHLSVIKSSSQLCTLVPSSGGLGFHIKGSSPVIIHEVDKGSAASQAGIVPGCAILNIGEENVVIASHDEVVTAVKTSLKNTEGQEGGRSVTLKLSYPFLEQMACYKYETSDSVTVDVYERSVESPYTFCVPSQLLRLYSLEMLNVVLLMSKSGVKSVKVTKYFNEIKSIASHYKKTGDLISTPRWPSYKVHGTQNIALDACPTNLHTNIIDVCTYNEPSPPPTPTSNSTTPANTDPASSCDSASLPTLKTQTSYCISTMAIPMVPGGTISKEDREIISYVQIRKELLQNLQARLQELTTDHDSISKMLKELHGAPSSLHNGVPSLGLPQDSSVYDDLTPSITPTSSPTTSRRRIVSISNPEPVIKLVAESLAQKVMALTSYLNDKLLLSVLEDSSDLLETTSRVVVDQFQERLKALLQELRIHAKRPGESLAKTAGIILETAKKFVRDLSSRIFISLALCDKTGLVLTLDKLFSQCLTSVLTAFAHHLVKAARNQLNPGVEYETKNAEASQQWLQMITKKGVLVHLQTTMLPEEEIELSALKDLQVVLTQLESVQLFVKKASSSEHQFLPDSDLPPITLEGDRMQLLVSFHVPPDIYSNLPPSLVSGIGIKVHPVLFNKGLVDLGESASGFDKERALNIESYKLLRKYYQSLRAFRLDKSSLPEDSDAKHLALHKISQPLNAMDLLMRQVEVAIKEPTRPGVALLTLAAELATRMGALRINICESGVFRSGLATGLEQVMVLGRCHGLPFKGFRSCLNSMRRKGGFLHIVRKNKADLSKSLPQNPPKLYQLPPETS